MKNEKKQKQTNKKQYFQNLILVQQVYIGVHEIFIYLTNLKRESVNFNSPIGYFRANFRPSLSQRIVKMAGGQS